MIVADPEAMETLGRRIGELAQRGTVIALSGDLGAGKSVLARGIGRGLGIEGRIPSPTFIVVAEYTDARLVFHHADLYRLSEADELENLGLDDVIGGDGVVAIEWAERFPEVLPADHLAVHIEIVDEARSVGLVAHGPRSRALLDALGG
ncbi:MAG: tRNA (adenosine(37)-N6)-threonylcarbamoyltransferase complex ATPase subunit type 1 TsaE [Myxococcota bacterium]